MEIRRCTAYALKLVVDPVLIGIVADQIAHFTRRAGAHAIDITDGVELRVACIRVFRIIGIHALTVDDLVRWGRGRKPVHHFYDPVWTHGAVAVEQIGSAPLRATKRRGREWYVIGRYLHDAVCFERYRRHVVERLLEAGNLNLYVNIEEALRREVLARCGDRVYHPVAGQVGIEVDKQSTTTSSAVVGAQLHLDNLGVDLVA